MLCKLPNHSLPTCHACIKAHKWSQMHFARSFSFSCCSPTRNTHKEMLMCVSLCPRKKKKWLIDCPCPSEVIRILILFSALSIVCFKLIGLRLLTGTLYFKFTSFLLSIHKFTDALWLPPLWKAGVGSGYRHCKGKSKIYIKKLVT